MITESLIRVFTRNDERKYSFYTTYPNTELLAPLYEKISSYAKRRQVYFLIILPSGKKKLFNKRGKEPCLRSVGNRRRKRY